MSRMAMVSAVLCIVLAVIIFVFADEPRKWYSGLFFALMGTILLVNSIRRRNSTDK